VLIITLHMRNNRQVEVSGLKAQIDSAAKAAAKAAEELSMVVDERERYSDMVVELRQKISSLEVAQVSTVWSNFNRAGMVRPHAAVQILHTFSLLPRSKLKMVRRMGLGLLLMAHLSFKNCRMKSST